MERTILGIKRRERVRNEKIRKRSKVVDVQIGYKLKSKKLQYKGHLVRGKKERWARKVPKWIP